MDGLQLFGQPQHVVVSAADQSVTLHLWGIRRCQAHGDGVSVDIQADVERRPGYRPGRHRLRLRLDFADVAQ
jgi:hypothetical protein